MTVDKENSKRKTCPPATSDKSNQAWASLGINLGLRGEKAATKCLGYGAADLSE
jgi:hypothetical protein